MTDFDPTKKSADAEAMAEYLQKTDDVLTGIDAMRANWRKYAPRFPKEQDERFELRRELSQMTNVFLDVLEGLASKPFQREVGIPNPSQSLAAIMEDIDGRSNHLSVFLTDILPGYCRLNHMDSRRVSERRQPILKPP